MFKGKSKYILILIKANCEMEEILYLVTAFIVNFTLSVRIKQARLAQSVERESHNLKVVSSILTSRNHFWFFSRLASFLLI